MALKDGLLSYDYDTEGYIAYAFYAFDDFLVFESRIGITEKRVLQNLFLFQKDYGKVQTLTQNSWLSDAAKAPYLTAYESRLQ